MHAHLSAPGHPNVVRLLCVLEDDEFVYVVQEHCDAGDLFSLVAARGGRVPEEEARAYMWGVVNGASLARPRGWRRGGGPACSHHLVSRASRRQASSTCTRGASATAT